MAFKQDNQYKYLPETQVSIYQTSLSLEVPEDLYYQIKSIPNWQEKLRQVLPSLVNQWRTIQRVTEPQQLNLAFECGLIQIFQSCFAEPPYYQYHSDKDTMEYFEEYRTQGVLYLAWRDSKVVGFTASLPLKNASIFEAEMEIQGTRRRFDRDFLRSQKVGVEAEEIQYVADLGVKAEYRHQGIGTDLLQTLLNHFTSDTPWLLRVLAELEHTQKFYKKFGFEPLPVLQTVRYLHQDQTYHTNKRFILAKNKLS